MQKQDYKYDKGGEPKFGINPLGDQVYLVDENGNQMYPPKGNCPFAKNKFGKEYYAKTREGNEVYPQKKKRAIFICEEVGTRKRPKLARYASGKEMYPMDKENNQYYFLDPATNEPIVLRDENGEIYFARNKNGSLMIPTRFFYQYQNENENFMKEYHLGVDFARNVVYVEGRKTRDSNILLVCLCQLIIGIPDAVSRILTNLKL